MENAATDCGPLDEAVVFLTCFRDMPDPRQRGKIMYPIDEVERHGWPGLNAIAMVESTRETKGAIEKDTRIFITSLVMLAHLLGPVIRSHWAIENSLHWVMDMTFRDDECRVRTNQALANFTTIKHMAYTLLRRPASKDSFRLRRKVAGRDEEFLASLLTA